MVSVTSRGLSSLASKNLAGVHEDPTGRPNLLSLYGMFGRGDVLLALNLLGKFHWRKDHSFVINSKR